MTETVSLLSAVLLFSALGFGDGFFHVRELLYWGDSNEQHYALQLGVLYTAVGVLFAPLVFFAAVFDHVAVIAAVWLVFGAGLAAMYYRRLYRWVTTRTELFSDTRRDRVAVGSIGASLCLLCVSPLFVGILLGNRLVVAIAPLVAVPWTWTFQNISQSKPQTPLESRSDACDGDKNVVFLMVDDVRRDRTSLHGYERRTTPFLERLAADRDPYVFQNCVSASTRSGHSIPSLLSGAFPSVHGYGANFENIRILSDEFRDAGYVTAGLSANGHITTPTIGDRFDWFGFFSAGTNYRFELQRLAAKLINALGFHYIPVYIKNPSAAFLNGLAKEFMRDRIEHEQRFFLFLTYMDVHDPYVRDVEALLEFAADHGESLSKGEWMRQTSGKMTEWYDDEYRDWGYDESIRYIDSQIADLYGFLADQGILDDTVVVITSDHGELLGERDQWGHIDVPYNPLFEVPLLIDDDQSGESVERIVSGAQLPSLLFDLSNVQPSEEMTDQWRATLSTEELSETTDEPTALVDFYPPEINTKGYEHPITGSLHEKDHSLTKQRLLVSGRWKILRLYDEYYLFEYEDEFLEEPVEPESVPNGEYARLSSAIQSFDEFLDANQYTGAGYYEELRDEKIRRQLEDLGYL